MNAAVEGLLLPDYLMPLGPGVPNEAMRPALQRFHISDVVDESMAQACYAGLWLYHNFLDESHRISQEIDTPTGSFWHAIMHRREPDAANSKYWWRRVGNHPVFAKLAEQAARLGWRTWEPGSFVDACEKERGSGSEREKLLREIQRAEWEVLFDWCHKQAITKS